MDEGRDSVEDAEDEEEDMDDEGDEEDDEDDDEKMSISDFSIDDEYAQLQIKQELKDAWSYFENRQLERAQKKQTKQFSGI